MGDALALVVPLALVVGLSPLPALPMIVLLSGSRPAMRALAFLAGWLVALAGVLAFAILVADGTAPDYDADVATGIDMFQVLLGALFVALGTRKWVGRPRERAAEPPRWLTAVAAYRPRQALRLGALMGGGNPKNIGMAVVAGVELALLPLAPVQSGLAAGVFLVVASVAAVAPLVASLVVGQDSATVLPRWQAWLVARNSVIMAGLMWTVGALLLLKGLGGSVPGGS